jgi:sec-independent protein translocase protein TatA
MQAVVEAATVLALFHLGGGEIILILALLLFLIGARKLPELGRGLGRGILEFREATKRLADAADDEAADAGRSVGGIYGKPAAEALTADNKVAELYEPAVFRKEIHWQKGFKSTFARMCNGLLRLIRAMLR